MLKSVKHTELGAGGGLIILLMIALASFSFSSSSLADAWISIGTGDINVGGGGSALISNVSIARFGDAPGSGIIIAWASDPAGPVDIWTRTGSFTMEASSWTKEKADASTSLSSGQGSWTNTNQVGQGTQKYFKVMPAGVSLTNADLTSEVVGKFDKVLPAGPSSSMVSTPLIPSSIDINSVIGNQLTGGLPVASDKIYYWDRFDWKVGYLNNNGTLAGTLLTFESDKGYYIIIEAGHPAKTITLVGNVTQSSRTINLIKGFNLIGSAFPLSVALNNSNISNLLTGGLPVPADKIYNWNGLDWSICYLKSDGTFAGDLSSFEPGKAYYIENQNLINSPNPDVWNYPKPY